MVKINGVHFNADIYIRYLKKKGILISVKNARDYEEVESEMKEFENMLRRLLDLQSHGKVSRMSIQKDIEDLKLFNSYSISLPTERVVELVGKATYLFGKKSYTEIYQIYLESILKERHSQKTSEKKN